MNLCLRKLLRWQAMKEAINKQEWMIGNAEIDKLKNEKEQRDAD